MKILMDEIMRLPMDWMPIREYHGDLFVELKAEGLIEVDGHLFRRNK